MLNPFFSSGKIYPGLEDAAALNTFGHKQFAALCIVSEVEIEKLGGRLSEVDVDITKEMPPVIDAEKSKNKKCERCWNYWPSVGADNEYPDLCKRCIEVINKVTGNQ